MKPILSSVLVASVVACSPPPGGSALSTASTSAGSTGSSSGASSAPSASSASTSSASASSTGAAASSGSSGASSGAASTGSGSGSSGAVSSSSASSSGGVTRGPVSLTFAGDPEGLWWDAPSSTLYVADQENNQIVTWTDAAGFAPYAVLPGGAAAGEDLGQLVLTQGYLLVTVFGFGTNGAIDIVFPDAGAVALAGLDPSYRRLGLGLDATGALYDSYFVKNASGSSPVGSVAQLTVSQAGGVWMGSESPVVTGLGKPVGVLSVGGNLVVTDQANGDFIVVAESALPTSSAPVVANNLSVDLLSAGPGGVFFTGSSAGDLEEITPSGVETAFASGYHNPRGSAFDAVNDRIFFGDHIQSTGSNQIVIVPGP